MIKINLTPWLKLSILQTEFCIITISHPKNIFGQCCHLLIMIRCTSLAKNDHSKRCLLLYDFHINLSFHYSRECMYEDIESFLLSSNLFVCLSKVSFLGIVIWPAFDWWYNLAHAWLRRICNYSKAHSLNEPYSI